MRRKLPANLNVSARVTSIYLITVIVTYYCLVIIRIHAEHPSMNRGTAPPGKEPFLATDAEAEPSCTVTDGHASQPLPNLKDYLCIGMFVLCSYAVHAHTLFMYMQLAAHLAAKQAAAKPLPLSASCAFNVGHSTLGHLLGVLRSGWRGYA
jgi:hypothetical protein